MKGYYYQLILCCIGAMALAGCNKYLPHDLDAFDVAMNYNIKEYSPILGRTTYYANNFDDLNSTLPLTFRISDIRTFSDEPAPELLKLFPVQIWTGRYSGKETSLEEIEAKRSWVNRPLFEIQEHSGEFIMWNTATSSILKTLPDSGYTFDVEINSSGGRKYVRDMILRPQAERPFEPYVTNGFAIPTTMSGIVGDSTGTYLLNADVKVWFQRVGDGHSLTFKFLDPDLQIIDPNKFGATKWQTLVHGFNMQKTNEFVRYDVAYPIPLVDLATPYTNVGGTEAHIEFAYDRIGFGGLQNRATLGIDFRIYQAGDWEVIFYFYKEAPEFENQ